MAQQRLPNLTQDLALKDKIVGSCIATSDLTDWESTQGRAGEDIKTKRDKWTGWRSVVMRGTKIDIRQANASVAKDKQGIFNTINKVPVKKLYTTEPNLKSPEIISVIQTLRVLWGRIFRRMQIPTYCTDPKTDWCGKTKCTCKLEGCVPRVEGMFP